MIGKFRESKLAHDYLDGLSGLEIGGAAHNPFGLNTINVDRFAVGTPHHDIYAAEQMRLCGEVMPVDVVAPGDKLPFADKSFDFVISSHVIEHFFDPLGALLEWKRVARKYIFIICPFRWALESDVDKPITPLSELIARHAGEIPDPGTDEHHTRWEPDGFIEMLEYLELPIVRVQFPDDKVGNGMCFIVKLD